MDKYIQRCLELADKSPCIKRKYGSVVVKDDKIIGEGYNHPVTKEMEELLCNPRIRFEINSGTRLELCSAVHAEQAAIINTYKNNEDPDGAALYVAGKDPDGKIRELCERGFYCSFCSRIMAEVGIEEVRVLTKMGIESLSKKEYLKYSYDFALGKRLVE